MYGLGISLTFCEIFSVNTFNLYITDLSYFLFICELETVSSLVT